MSQNQQQRMTADKSVFEDLSLAKASTIQSNPHVVATDGMPPYISEVSRIRIMRQFYKKEIQKYLDDNLCSLLENEKTIKLQTANKLKVLVDCNRSILNRMDKQRDVNGEMIKEFLKTSNSMIENTNINGQKELIMLADASIKNLLSEFKQQSCSTLKP